MIDLLFSEILKITEVGENQQMNDSNGILIDNEPLGFEMIHAENVEVCLKLDPHFFTYLFC